MSVSIKTRLKKLLNGGNPLCGCHRIAIFQDYTCLYHKTISKLKFKWKYLTNSKFRSDVVLERYLCQMIKDEINKDIIREIYKVK
jgi:hypothetical protein